MTTRTQQALQFGYKAGLFMAAVAALNFALGGWKLTTGLLPRVALLIALCFISFLLYAAVFFALAYVDGPQDSGLSELTMWTRPLRRRQVVIAYLAAGWLAGLLIIGVGDYKLRQHQPTLSELGDYVLLAAVLAPIIALLAAGFLAYLRHIQRIVRDG